MEGAANRKFASSLLLYYTGITRSADKILNKQKSNLQSTDRFDNMQRMVALVDPFTEAMLKQDIGTCGNLLARNWELKQNMAAGISNSQIDEMHNRAIAAGALAGKVAGAGGGGFLLLIVPRESQNNVFEAMKPYRELPFMIAESGSKVIFDDRSYTSK